MSAWRDVAVKQGAEQWCLFFETGRFSKDHDVSRTGYDRVGTSFGQMIRTQVVSLLDSWVGNRQNEFSRIVSGSSLPDRTKHELRFVNRWKGWYRKDLQDMKDGSEISEETRRLARAIFRHLRKTHRTPDFSRINYGDRPESRQDHNPEDRQGLRSLAPAFHAKERIPGVGSPPTYDYLASREGKRSLSVQINEARNGQLRFGLLTDMTDAFAKSRQTYVPLCEEVALDLGIPLFASDQGDLLGRNWLDVLLGHDKKIQQLAAYRQKHGLRVGSPRYDRLVSKLKGFITSEIGRILNMLVARTKPGRIVVERLDFRNPNLSRRLNRILQNFGKGVLQRKLRGLEERYGIEIVEVPSAYTSQECHVCGYVDKRNRPDQKTFHCLWCGRKEHADGNAARVLRKRRSLSDPGLRAARPKQTLVRLAGAFLSAHRPCQWWKLRRWGTLPDPRLSNPYFRAWASSVT